jgi:hypothetical protein
LIAQNGGDDTPVTEDDNNDSFFSSMDWNGNEFGIVWEDERDGNFEIYFTRLDAKGNKKADDIRITNNDAASLKPDIRWTGSQYGVTWHDNRDGNEEIYFITIDFLGNKLTSDKRITDSNGESSFPSLIWNGSVFGIAWKDDRDYSPGSGNYEIYFTRADVEGYKIESDIRVTNLSSLKGDPSLSWNGVDYGVAWEDARDGNFEIYYARLDESGNKQDSDVRITDSEGDSVNPSIQWNGVKYGLVWQDNRSTGLTLQLNDNIYYNGIDSIGDKEDDDSLITSAASNSTNPSLAWADGEWGVAFADDRYGDEEIYHARLSSDGIKKSDEERMTNAPNSSDYPEIVWNGEDYGMTWQDLRNGISYEVYFKEICANPEKLGSELKVTDTSNDSWHPSLVWTGSEYGVSFSDKRDSDNPEIYFARLDSSGNKIGSEVRVTFDYEASGTSSLVWTGNEYGVSWMQHISFEFYSIYFARLDSSGNKIGSDVRVTNAYPYSLYPSLVWTGTEYGISWEDRRDGNFREIYFARVDSSGSKIGSEIRVTYDSANSYSPSLVWTGSEYGISWSDSWEIYLARLDSSGNKIGSDIRITYDSEGSYRPSLVWTGSEYAVSWDDYQDIYFARLDSSGNKIGSDIMVTEYDSAPSDNPCLVRIGSEYGVSWSDTRDGPDYPYNYEIYFARLDSSGNKIGSEVRVTHAYDSSAYPSPSLVWSGSEYGISWHDKKDGDNEIYFVLMGCCTDDFDVDKDRWCWQDCDYDDSTVYPGADELCNDTDNNCDGTLDNKDSDNDGYIDEDCTAGDDCDDDNPVVNPDEGEILCNGLDENCDITDDAPDNDGDGYDVCSYDDVVNPDNLERDCNDASSSMNSEEAEICNGYDDNCDGFFDEGCDTICEDPEKKGSDIRVTYVPSLSFKPSLIWTGSEYGVSWYEYWWGNSDIYFTRLDSSGNKIGSDIRVTYDSSSSSFLPSLVWSGSEYGLSWEDSRDGGAEIYFARLDSSGNIIGSDVRVTFTSSDSKNPSLIWTGRAYGISWSDSRDALTYPYKTEIYFARLDSSGDKIGSDVRLTYDPADSRNPSLVCTGKECGVSWDDMRDESDPEIYFARVDSSGNKIGSDIRVTNASRASRYPSLIWIGSEYAISWQDHRDGNMEIYFARLDSHGNKIGEDIRVTSDDSGSVEPALIWTGSEYGVSWSDGRDAQSYYDKAEIYFARIDSSGKKIGPDLRVTNASKDSRYPSLKWNGSEYSVSWSDERDGDNEIYFARMDCPLGVFIDFEPETLNLKSKGKWITCYIELPKGYSAHDIDISTIALSVDGSGPIYAESKPTSIGDYDSDGISDLMIKFSRSSIQEVASEGDAVPFEISGNLLIEERINGKDHIRVIE